MAASIYATPPPDLSSEDTSTAITSSDLTLNSNRSSSNNSNNNNNHNINSTQQQQQQRHSSSSSSSGGNNNRNEATLATTSADATAISSSCSSTTASSPKAVTTTTITTTSTAKQKQKRSIAKLNIGAEDTTTTTTTTSTSTSISEALTGSSMNAIAGADINMQTLVGDDDDEQSNSSTTMAAMAAAAAAANAAMQLQLLEAIKKRRKQHNPSRLEALNLSGNESAESAAVVAPDSSDEQQAAALSALSVDYEEKLSKMFLPKSIEQLKETFELLQHQQRQQQQQQQQEAAENISQANDGSEDRNDLKNPYQTYCKQCGENFENEFKLSLHMLQEHAGVNSGAGEISGANPEDSDISPMDFLASVKVKLERPDSPGMSGVGNGNEAPSLSASQQYNPQIEQATAMLANGKENWLNAMPHSAMSAGGFPFPPEAAAAAALGAGGYLPLLGVPGFPGVDSLNRPPLRIFNPEAYCELCNKEFCNKYFLKTHKANKHGIYDPVGDSTASGVGTNNNNSSSNNNNSNSASVSGLASMSAMNQMFQLQMQQQQQQQQQLQLQMQQQQKQAEQQKQQQAAAESPLILPQQLTPPAPPPVHCDICAKRFTNVFAMRRHRAKAHDQSSPPTQQRSSPNEQQPPTAIVKQEQLQPVPVGESSTSEPSSKQFQMPDGFRQDFTLEQEEVSFTPQPRKLSPQLQQQAREANFAHDKLKRLGVHNPESFCEICCKEYCNKYFLRTHKWKRHGIFVPPEELKDQEQLQLAQKMAWPFMNLPSMPFNLMVANEKAVAAQRMLAAAANAEQSAESESGQLAKRIKLEPNDKESTDDFQEPSHSEQLLERNSIPNTPEPQKLHTEQTTPEAAMGLQNLQKLQSMIQQLSDLNGKRPMPCHMCGRELENQYALQAHIMTEHAGMGLEGPLALQQQIYQQHSLLQQQQQQAMKLSPSGGSPGASEMRCQQCERDFTTPQEFKQHITEVHLLPSSPLREGFYTPERPINPNPLNASGVGTASGGPTRPPYTITPTSSYCEICNKELCNKYFMKTHMQRMHGIEIENGAQIGGVVCNICNKELCSKYFLRVHKHNTHGIIEDGAPLPQPRGQNGLKFEVQQQQQPQLVENELSRTQNVSPFGGSIPSNDSSYNETCPLCPRHFRSAKWLRSHLMNDHGTAGVEKIRELDQQFGTLSKPNSPTLKIPNGSSNNSGAAGTLPNSASLAQALQNLNAQHLLGQMPKNMLPGMFGASVAEQTLQSPRYKEYQCSICPFTTPYYAFLFIHERSHAIMNNTSGDKNAEMPLTESHSTDATLNVAPTKQEMALALVQEKPEKETTMAEAANLSTTIRTLTPTRKQTPSPTLATATLSPTLPRPIPATGDAHPVTTSNNHTPTSTVTTEVNSLSKPGSPISTSFSAQPSPSPTGSTNGPKPEHLRSAATTPIEALLNDMAQNTSKPVSYALPQLEHDNAQSFEMQAFHIHPTGDESVDVGGAIIPAIVYLPVRQRIGCSTTLQFKLTPA